jgi:hypothetical protein
VNIKNVERPLVALVIASFALVSTIILGAHRAGLTKEEAIETSRNTSIVQEALSQGGIPRVTADHWNATYIVSLKQEHPNLREIENLPEDHGVWRVFWVILQPGYHILHYIDDLTGKVLHESVSYAG